MSTGPCRREEETAFAATPATSILWRLLPDATTLRLEACSIDDTATQITLLVCATPATAPCPRCMTLAHRIHSRYERTLADLPWAHYRVRLQLRVRKWLCQNSACVRRIFTERLPTVAAPWARRTLRLAQRLVALGVALGGAARGSHGDAGGRSLSPAPEPGGSARARVQHAWTGAQGGQ